MRSRSFVATCVVAALTGATALLAGPVQAANDQRTPGSGAPVVIGMVDTGVNATHQEFSYNPSIAGPNGQFVAWWDFSADADSHLPAAGQIWDTAEPSPYDPNGHGTITASMAAGRNVTSGKTKSFAPGYNLSVAKVGDAAGSISGDLAAAIRWQVDDARADIISMSIGEIAPLPAVISEPVFSAIAYARQHGVLVVVANGNGWANFGILPGEPGWAAAYGDSTNVLSVGAAGLDGYLVTMDPMVTAQYTVTGASNTNNTGTVTESGTSFATPLTAGFAARLMDAALTAGTDASGDHIKKLIEYSAQDTTTPPQFEGYGTINTIGATQSTTPQLTAALANASAGTLPSRPSPDINGLYVETVTGNLRDLWTNKLSDPSVLMPTFITPDHTPGLLGPSAPVGLSDGEVYSVTLAPGQTTTIDLHYVLDSALADAQDMDLYAFSGVGTTFHSADVAARSANGAGLDEQITLHSTTGGVYSIVALGWAVARNQAFTITSSNAPLTYEYEGYYLQTIGLGL